MTSIRQFFFVVCLVALFAEAASAQVATGTPPFGTFASGNGPEVIDLANLNSHLTIPVLHKAGRGTDFTYDLSYDSSLWYPVTSGSTTSWQPASNWGWRGATEVATGYISNTFTYASSGYGLFCKTSTWSNWAYHDAWGVSHQFAGESDKYTGSYKYCGDSYSDGFSSTATDGSGYSIVVAAGSGSLYTLDSSYGKVINAPINSGSGTATSIDRTGNIISVDSSEHFYDTLSSTTPVLTLSGTGTPSSPFVFTYTAPSGASASFTMKFASYTVQTNFGCSNISDFGPTSEYLVSEIDLPDIAVNSNDKYTFTYESTPGHSGNVTGRLTSVTLPTGGTITYTYIGGSSGNITCSDGSTASLKRFTPDTGSNYWEYDRAAGTGAAYTTTVTDPTGSTTVVQFQGIYETQRDMYQGAVSSSNLLQTVKTCYNGNTSNCTSTAITLPITQRNATTVLSGGLQSEHDDFWNIYGAPTETDDYDYGSGGRGPLLKRVLATYATNLGSITAFRQTVTTCNGTGSSPTCNGTGTPVAQVVYNYDETTPTTTSLTPQHNIVPAPWGNLTSTVTSTGSSSALTKKWTYYDTGNVNQFTDVNNGITTYNYASGAASCYNSFATSTTEAVSGLSSSQTWNCTGGVQLTSTDENGQTTTASYTDPYFWRPASTTDPTNAATSFCYGILSGSTCTLNPNQTESVLTFNGGSSAADTLASLDGLSRAHIQQTRQAPNSANFDSVETDYDSMGRVSRVTLPYTGTAGLTNSTIASTTTTYDAMSRLLTVNDGGGGTTTYSYGNPGSQKNDTLITRSPAPTGENTKRRQFESDGLGRLASNCELTSGTSAWPGGTCGQNTTQTGYWTKYNYDPMNNLLSVTQNAQSTSNQQTRTFVYDWMSRMTSETVPEIGATGNGTATYTYDTDSTCGTYKGDLVKRVDAAGDVICLTYDAIHRTLTTTYPSGTYASVTPAKHFVYDAATINTSPSPTAMTNVKGRLAEAYTCTGSCSTKLTDIGLSYSLRGENSEIYEATPNSGTYYHLKQTYWDNRAPNQLTGNIGLPATITNSPDGEGRVNTVTASSGQNPVSGTSYNAASLPTAINLGSGTGDKDAFSYDPNTNRMTQYQFTVNSTILTGAIGWNANNTLQTQNITDGFNAPDTQNCAYVYDDITRLASANCGTAASQTFSYDPFGNINKSGSPYSFNPTYSYSPPINRISTVGNTTAHYDNNGGVTSDGFHTYTWDAEGHAISVDAGLSGAVSLTYDALGRMAEQNRSGSYTQIVYSPTRQKLALMSGQTLQKAMVPLSGKALAVYNASGMLYYAHPDYLGTARLATSPSRTMYFDTAYAPFGETYASAGTLDPSYTGQMNDTGHRQDTAGGLYDFLVREYSTQGRWPNPDPLGKGATSLNDPQTQNRYAYVRNNPMTYTDPTGMQAFGFQGKNEGGCDPADPSCNPSLLDAFVRPGRGDGCGGSPQPQPFPWPSPGIVATLASNFTRGNGSKSCARQAFNACLYAGGPLFAAALGAEEVCIEACVLSGPGIPECVAGCIAATGIVEEIAVNACIIAATVAYIHCKLF
jgi:RHS repeat-associated protein